MLNVTRQFGHEWANKNEDIWFAKMLEKISNQFPTTDVAMEFAFVRRSFSPRNFLLVLH